MPPVARLAAAALLCAGAPCWGAPAPASVTAVPSALPAEADVRAWRFVALLDGKPIGTHDFSVAGATADAHVRTHASFKVTALLIPLYQYEHEDHEHWRDGCLVEMEAHTRDNGRESSVHGHATGTAFEVRSPQGTASLPGCVKSFAYWDKRFLAEQRLLNPQTGEYEPVKVSHLGLESISLHGQNVPAEHYLLSGRKLRIELWYSATGAWLALQSLTEQGRVLRYAIR